MDIFKITILSALSIMFIGCSNNPQNSVEQMYEALKDGDVPKLYRITTEPKARALTVDALKDCSVDKSTYTQDNFKLGEDCFKEMYGNINVKNIQLSNVSDTKADATVIYENNSKSITKKEYLRKIDGKWLVSRYK